MRPGLAIVAMVNGMIGGLTLVLPILATETGTILTALVLLLTGFFSFYSCYLCIIHLGNQTDYDKTIFHHFGESMPVKVFYDLLVFINLLFIQLLYFNLIVKQWEGLITSTIAIPLANAAVLLILAVLLKYFHLGAKLMGYGIVSIISYCIFLVWLVVSAPSGEDKIPLFGKGGVNLAAAMGGGFAIQMFFIPVLKQLPDPTKYVRYTLAAYVIGGSIYFYIAYAGRIINRTEVVLPLQTIEDYFQQDQWQVAIIECIYLVHLYSAYGQFLLICKKRFFSMFGKCLVQSKQGQMLRPTQIVFIIAAIGLAMGIYFAGVSIEQLIQFNGAVITYFFIYLLPATMHFKCRYLSKRRPSQELRQRATEIIIDRHVQLSQRNNSVNPNMLILIGPEKSQSHNIEHNRDKQVGQQNYKIQVATHHQAQTQNEDMLGQNLTVAHGVYCDCTKPKPLVQVLDLICLAAMLAFGTFILVDGLINIIQGNA